MNTLRILTALAVLFVSVTIFAADLSRPNVIVIYSDDQGSVDLGCYGTKDVLSPHLDGLAETGVRFTQMYAPAPVCSASRAGLLTGKMPARAGVPANVSCMFGRPGMPTEQYTMAELFRDAGYRTALFGKWHLGYSPDTMPAAQGFDEHYGIMGGVIDNWSHYIYWEGACRHDLWKNGKEIFEPGQYFPQRMTDECIDFIQRHKGQPFFTYVAYTIAHYPVQPLTETMEAYENITPQEILRSGNFNSTVDIRRLYTAFITDMDTQIGRIVETLEKEGLRDNTIIVFQADQGHSFEERTGFGGGWAGPYRGGKFSLYEGGIRVPSVVSWPKSLPKGVVRNQMLSGCDWMPTLAELCGVAFPEPALKEALDGKSFANVLKSDAPSPHETLYWDIKPLNQQWAVRKGDWKLLANPLDISQPTPWNMNNPRLADIKPMPPLVLIDLKADPGETTNLVEKHPEVVEELNAIRAKYLERLKN